MFSHGIKIILVSHAFFWIAASILTPFFVIFLVTELKDVTYAEIGIGLTIFYLSTGLMEPVAGLIADRIKGFKDELFLMVIGYGMRGLILLLLSLSQNVWHLYYAQFGLGIFGAFAAPSARVLYSKLMAHKQSASLWGLDESVVYISAALGAAIGGYFAQVYGFRMMIAVSGLLTIIAGMVNLFLIQDIRKLR